MANAFTVIVWFATSSSPRGVAKFTTLEAAQREARSYMSDARGVWIEMPDGTQVKQ